MSLVEKGTLIVCFLSSLSQRQIERRIYRSFQTVNLWFIINSYQIIANHYQNNLHVSNEITCLNFSSQDKKFVIVLFKNANELGVVPCNWINNGLCAWLPQKDKKGYARKRVSLCINWVKYDVKQYESVC